jgi:Fe2+ or Zn2+ uptake regulation protein
VKSPNELAAAFRANGLKVTPQRQLLFGLLDGDTTHPTAESLYARASELMPGISLRTVYTTLADLAEMGELQSVNLGGGATRFDPNVDDHHHGICDTCGAVIDLYVDEPDDLRPLGDFTVRSTSIVFHGCCADCASTARTRSHPSTHTNKEHHHA